MCESDGRFRTDAEWRTLFELTCLGFRLAESAFVRERERVPVPGRAHESVWVGLRHGRSTYQRYDLLLRSE